MGNYQRRSYQCHVVAVQGSSTAEFLTGMDPRFSQTFQGFLHQEGPVRRGVMQTLHGRSFDLVLRTLSGAQDIPKGAVLLTLGEPPHEVVRESEGKLILALNAGFFRMPEPEQVETFMQAVSRHALRPMKPRAKYGTRKRRTPS